MEPNETSEASKTTESTEASKATEAAEQPTNLEPVMFHRPGDYFAPCATFLVLSIINDWFFRFSFTNEKLNGLFMIIGYFMPLACAVIMILGIGKRVRMAGYICVLPALILATTASIGSGAEHRLFTGEPGFWTLRECQKNGASSVCRYERNYWPIGHATVITSERIVFPGIKKVTSVKGDF
jgi:hypothetical protein